MNENVKNSIKILTRTYYDYQNERMRLDGRLGQKKNGEIKDNIPERDASMLLALQERREYCYAMEKQLEKDIAKEIHQHPLWKQFLFHVKGCGPMMAAVIITEFDIYKAEYVGSLWCFAGLAPGKDKKKKGEKCPYNQFLKSKLMGVLAGSFIKSNSPYREFCNNMRNRYESEDWGIESKKPTTKNKKAGHQNNAAKRYMIKMFLKDLYVAWRTIEGLPVVEPYQEKYLGHKHNA